MGAPYAGLVLVVDDDSTLRHGVREYLMKAGCGVLEARDAYDGLFACAQYGHAIDLLITEINILPVGGIKLAENASRLWPRIQILCTSANVDIRGVEYWMNYLNAGFLPKPFTPEQLHEKVFAMLNRRMDSNALPHGGHPNAAATGQAGQSPGGQGPGGPDQRPAGPEAGQAPVRNVRNPMFWLTEF